MADPCCFNSDGTSWPKPLDRCLPLFSAAPEPACVSWSQGAPGAPGAAVTVTVHCCTSKKPRVTFSAGRKLDSHVSQFFLRMRPHAVRTILRLCICGSTRSVCLAASWKTTNCGLRRRQFWQKIVLKWKCGRLGYLISISIWCSCILKGKLKKDIRGSLIGKRPYIASQCAFYKSTPELLWVDNWGLILCQSTAQSHSWFVSTHFCNYIKIRLFCISIPVNVVDKPEIEIIYRISSVNPLGLELRNRDRLFPFWFFFRGFRCLCLSRKLIGELASPSKWSLGLVYVTIWNELIHAIRNNSILSEAVRITVTAVTFRMVGFRNNSSS